MKNIYREILLRSDQHGEREHSGALLRLVRIIFFSLFIWFWLAATAVYIASLIAVMGNAAVRDHGPITFPDFFLLGLTAGMIVACSAISQDIGAVAKWTWTQFEDTLGRVVVFAYAASRTFIPDRMKPIRKILAWLAASVSLTVVLYCLKWTFANLPMLSVGQNSLSTFTQLAGNPKAVPFVLGLLLTSTLSLLIWRFYFSPKWQSIFSQPRCIDLHQNSIDSKTASSTVKILHASDFHITDNDTQPLVEGRHTLQDKTIRKILDAIKNDAHDCKAILLTGDITDAGSAQSWDRFLNHCPESILKKIVLVPGNHDLNLQDHTGVIKAERFDRFGRRMRQIRALCAMTEIMGERAFVLDRQTDRILTLGEYFKRNNPSIDAAIDRSGKTRRTIAEIWDGLFPMVVPIEGTRLGIIIVDSTKPASIGLTNAIGAVPPEVISTCHFLMTRVSDKCDSFVFALHHHIAVPFGGSIWKRFQNAGLVFENAVEFIEMLSKRGDPTIVFHGHRHVAYTGMVEDTDVSIVASPSASFGPHGKASGGNWRKVTLATEAHGCRLAGGPELRSLNEINSEPKVQPQLDHETS